MNLRTSEPLSICDTLYPFCRNITTRTLVLIVIRGIAAPGACSHFTTKFGYYWVRALITWHLRKQLFTTWEIASSRVLESCVASTGEFRCKYWRVSLRVLASFVASTPEFRCEYFDREICRASARVITRVSCTRSSMMLTCDLAGHARRSHSFVNLQLSATVHVFDTHVWYHMWCVSLTFVC